MPHMTITADRETAEAIDSLNAVASGLTEAEINTLTGLAKMLRMGHEARMIAQYGEACTKSAASRILSRTPNTVNSMLNDGRLESVCGGTMVSVRSIARYISSPPRADFEAFARKRREKLGSSWSV